MREDFEAYLDAFGEDVLVDGVAGRLIVDRENTMIDGPEGVVGMRGPSVQGVHADWPDIAQGTVIEVPAEPGSDTTIRYKVNQKEPDGRGWFVAQLTRAPEAPEVSSATVPADGTSVVVAFDRPVMVDDFGTAQAGWNVTVNDSDVVISDAQLTATDELTLTVPVVYESDTVLLSYSESDGFIRTPEGASLLGFEDRTVQNNSEEQNALPCETLESPGIFSAFGAGAMDINGLTATNSDGSTQGANVESTVSMPATDNRILFEVHYDPADWAGATGSNFVAIGDVTQGDDLRVNLEDTDGQNNSALAFAAVNSGGTGFIVYDGSGNALDIVSSSLSEIYAQVISEHEGGSVTFVTDKDNFIVPVPENTAGTDYSWCEASAL